MILLSRIRDIFDRRGTDRLHSKVIVDELNDLPDAPWSEWRGPKGDQSPRKLTQWQLAIMLGAFGIRPRSIWPSHRTATTKSAKGYLRASFEAAWRAYCDGGTPAQHSNIRHLWRSHQEPGYFIDDLMEDKDR